ncbi:MAG: type I-B CRISPR-associated protein Cas7/Csh2 [Candidatus Cloacimonadaceae bacterium]|jgi:CRISPR-associated protein Csh2|nr:type I-B CRISPR-associated protein Cas7/Csh2 [Candidatus Cloacimonadaceae bacterium]
MSELKRTEILFLYDVQNANPNGDPSDENKPRIDEETKHNIVTDVRLKRTIRDYLYNYEGYNQDTVKDIFVRQTFMEEDPTKGLKDGKNRAKTYKGNFDLVLNACIDVRLFGGVIPLDKASITFTGPVQFKMGHSLHRVEPMYIKGTGAFASKPGVQQQTFREEYILPYSFIAFYGIINENAARQTRLTASDIEMLKKGIWNGTKQLITRSKMEHNPRLLLMLEHKSPNFFIGELDKHIRLKSELPDEKIRSIGDFKLDMSPLKKILDEMGDKRPEIFIQKDPNLELTGW